MAHEGKEEVDLMEVVFCRGVQKFLKIDSCNKECEYHKGIQIEPVMTRENGKVTQTGEIKNVKCCYPRFERITTVCEV